MMANRPEAPTQNQALRTSQRQGALPLHQQVSEMLIREIASGHIVDNSRLAPEREMAVDLGIAVGTLRKALADLEEKGLLDRVQGSGNYIRAGGKDGATIASVYSFFRLELVSGGGLPTAEVLSVQTMPKPSDLPQFGKSETAHRIRRLRSIGAKAAALEEIWLDGSYISEISADDLSESLYLFYKNTLGLWITHVEDRVGIDHVPAWSTDTFGLPAGNACGYIERVSRSQEGVSAEYSRTWFDSNIARYVARLK
jgi:GntR family transcriptional regulator